MDPLHMYSLMSLTDKHSHGTTNNLDTDHPQRFPCGPFCCQLLSHREPPATAELPAVKFPY